MRQRIVQKLGLLYTLKIKLKEKETFILNTRGIH
jgi:hypothetical protein